MSDKPGRRGDRKVFRRQTLPGATPGTIMTDPGAPHPVIRVMAWSGAELVEEEVADTHRLREYVENWPMAWVNIDGLGDEAVLKQLGDIFDIHKLALEDIVNVHQRAKVEDYNNHLFVVTRMINLLEGRLETEQISLFLGKGFLVTFQEQAGDCLEPVRDRIRKKSGRICRFRSARRVSAMMRNGIRS